ncbi:MAG: DNA starvation/stationary phase protection protein [Nitrososphaeraceae archaeon]|nr:DNA starvation/stationary phase protection protein [Nitrososphaeraceae archaeon]
MEKKDKLQITDKHTTNIGLTKKNAQGVAQILEQTMSDEYVLSVKTKNYHWNVTGPQFNELHKFFDEHYEEIDEFIDEVAERIRSLGIKTIGSMADFLKNTRLKEDTSVSQNTTTMLNNLLNDHEELIRNLRNDLTTCDEKFADAGNADFLTGLMEKHEKIAWMLRAFLS